MKKVSKGAEEEIKDLVKEIRGIFQRRYPHPDVKQTAIMLGGIQHILTILIALAANKENYMDIIQKTNECLLEEVPRLMKLKEEI